MTRICFILGTRPEIIKLFPVIVECKKRKVPFALIHTNQHYSADLDSNFFRELRLSNPGFNLSVGSGTHAEITGKALIGIEKALLEIEPKCVVVQGDTNSAFAGALAAAKLHIPVAHVEAGLRSYSREMPEELNRVLIDHTADFLFAPTRLDARVLIAEGISKKKISVVGNTIVDAVRSCARHARASDTLKKNGLVKGAYIFFTSHRQENVDNPERFAGILEGVDRVSKMTGFSALYPIHHRALQRLKDHAISMPKSIRVIPPTGFFDSLHLQKNARLVITDSGGVQEEACILGVPCVTVRDNTERPDTVRVGANILAGTTPSQIERCARIMLSRKKKWKQPFGRGIAAQQILDVLI